MRLAVRAVVRAIVVASTLGLGAASAPAGAIEGSAERLINECRANSAYCEGYLSASVEAHQIANMYVLTVSGHRMLCLPETVSLAAVRAALLAYADRRPGDAVYSAGTYVANLLEAQFPCRQ